jgi:hypothetical protein
MREKIDEKKLLRRRGKFKARLGDRMEMNIKNI